MDASDTALLRAFLLRWPAGSHLTTRAVQVLAGLPSLDATLRATVQLNTEGLLEMERIGATLLWYPRVVPVPAGDLTLRLPITPARDAVPALARRP